MAKTTLLRQVIESEKVMMDVKFRARVIKPGEAGASLVAVLIAVGFLVAVIYFSTQAYRNLQVSQRVHQASMAARDLEEVIISGIIKKQIEYINVNKCAANMQNYFDNFALGSAANIRTQLPVFKALDRVTVISPPTRANAAFSRCKSAKKFDGSTPATSTTLYHCLNIETTPPSGVSRHNFLANLGAFIEVVVKFKNLATNDDLTCDKAAVNIVNGNKVNLGNGLEVYHNLHWTISDSVGKILYKNKVGSLRVSL